MTEQEHGQGGHVNLLVILLSVVFLGVVARTAWLSDAAYLDLRTADNLTNGYGLRWDVNERVQVTDHPLWTLFVGSFYYFTQEHYYSTVLVSITLSFITILIFAFGIAESPVTAVVGLSILTLSKAFVDYSTSGQETPLSHLLLVCFLFLLLRQEQSSGSLLTLSLVASLIMLTRLDLGLLILPLLGFVLWKRLSISTCLSVCGGFLPLVGWEVFALFYYGVPFSNPFYADIYSGVHTRTHVLQGVHYLLNSLNLDPLTLCVILSVSLLALTERSSFSFPMASGLLLYLINLLVKGGDLWSGHLLAAPLLCSVVILSRWQAPILKTWLPIWMLVIVIGFFPKDCPVLSGPEYGSLEASVDHKISHDRKTFYPWTGFSRVQRDKTVFGHTWSQTGEQLRKSGNQVTLVSGNVGIFGYFSGPRVHLINPHGTTDPLLARLPLKDKKDLRAERYLPLGYYETIQSGTNCLREINIAEYYDTLSLLTRADLLAEGRLSAILDFNLRKGGDQLLKEHIKHPVYRLIDCAFGSPSEEGSTWNAPGNLILVHHPVTLLSPQKLHRPIIEISLDSNDTYRVTFLLEKSPCGELQFTSKNHELMGLTTHRTEVPAEAREGGYDRIMVNAFDGDGSYSLGYVHFLE